MTSEPGTTAPRWRTWLPMLLWLLIVFMSLATVWMILVTSAVPTPEQWGFRGFEPVLALAFGSVGALVAARRPENRFGWMVLAISVVAALQGIVDQYPTLAAASNPPLPYGMDARWVAVWIWTIPSFGFLGLIPLVFPEGRLLSPRWRSAVLIVIAAIVIQTGITILATEPIGPVAPTQNPAVYFSRVGPVMALGYVVALAGIGAGVAAAVIRYRRSSGEERQQLKWVAFAIAFLPFAAPAGFSGLLVGQLALIAAGVFASAAMAIAILRYRLYEIDVIINRTLVYGALSAILAGVYTASIALTQRVFSAVTGDRSDAAIVITTLIIVSLFTPIKSRLQAIVDARLKTPHPAAAGAIPAPALDVLARLDQLRASGTISAAEFETAKQSLLERAVSSAATTETVEAG